MAGEAPRTASLTRDDARWLVSAHGTSARTAAVRALEAGATTLAATSSLRSEGLGPEQVAAAMSSAEATVRMPPALRRRGDLVFTRDALEQASDPMVSAWRARRFAGRVVADLACGAGGDLLSLAEHADRAVGVDLDEARVVLARHNLQQVDAPPHVVVGDALAAPVRGDAVHADPSRRAGARRARMLADYEPGVGALTATLGGVDAGIVVSPAVNWTDPDLPGEGEVEFIQVGRSLREAVIWTGDLRRPAARATATLLDPVTGVATTRSGESTAGAELDVHLVGPVLIEVEAAAVRARLHDALGAEIGAHRVAHGRALLTAATVPPASPWYRRWLVEADLAARPKAVSRWLRSAEPLPLEIATSGFDADPEAWWRAMGRPPRGPQGRRLLLVRLDGRSAALVLRPPDASEG